MFVKRNSMNMVKVAPLKIKVELKSVPHPVTRIILVPENITMLQLHLTIQLCMGWWGNHLFQFMDYKNDPTIIASFANDPEYFYDGMEEKEAHKVKLKKAFFEMREARPFWYWYDFGDDWWHHIRFLKPSKRDMAIFELQEGSPTCVEAIGTCPPEDVGGVRGYEEFCKAVNDPKHPEYESFREWADIAEGSVYDFEQVDIFQINEELETYFESKSWKRKTAEVFAKGLFA
ncbi:hypothetical protein EL17_00980 [Anditalea andensis]|uniref:Plasmid pRiA4b Orf3-like domain-containing protein n=2 Tax=Anditalea andensis TaxID=1048983 RepID=A0A074L6J9_9BACT|nr:hypothetical protein EL17_00980 [Anditalea andensis]